MDNKRSNTSPFGESEPIYYEVSPFIVNALRVLGVISALMVLLAFIFTLVQGSHNHNFYMLTCNIILTAIVGLGNVYWYWKGQLAADKHWYMLLVGLVIIWQCIATDIYVFHLPSPQNTTVTMTGPTTISTTTLQG